MGYKFIGGTLFKDTDGEIVVVSQAEAAAVINAALASADGGVQIGAGATVGAGAGSGIAIGDGATVAADADYGVAIQGSAPYPGSVAIGRHSGGARATADAWNQIALGAAGQTVKIPDAIQGAEIAADPAAPAANGGLIYFKDNGSGKTILCVRFASGAVQTIATQP